MMGSDCTYHVDKNMMARMIGRYGAEQFTCVWCEEPFKVGDTVTTKNTRKNNRARPITRHFQYLLQSP